MQERKVKVLHNLYHYNNDKNNLHIMFLNQFGFVFHNTPKKYAGTPVNVITTPIRTSYGASKQGITRRNTQIITNIIGTAIFTLMGLTKLGCFHLKYKIPVTESVIKNVSTIVQYVISS